MATSDSEDFESADEGHNSPIKKERKSRLSSSNYSDSALETEQIAQQMPIKTNDTKEHVDIQKDTDGWDDFDIDDDIKRSTTNEKENELSSMNSENKTINVINKNTESETGWDDFDDWGQGESNQNDPVPVNTKKQPVQPDQEIKAVPEKLASASTGSSWGWGWSVDSLLSTATAGISTLTTHVSQGISTVLETGIGAPDPEELAKQKVKDRESNLGVQNDVETKSKDYNKQEMEEPKGNESDTFAFGSLISGVTKFVETTGTKVISGGLDTLETIGKKTMEVLQDGDPGLAKKRAMLGLNTGDKLVLSQVLREAKVKAEEEDKIREQKREAKEVHYENLFDDFEGLVHLEALEMLSRQVSMRIEERMRGLDPDKRQDIKETLQQVAELCEMPEEEEDDDSTEHMSKTEAFLERLQTSTQDLGLKLQFLPLTKQYTEILDWLASTETEFTDKMVYKRAVSALAHATALSVELYHKAGEMLLVKTRRSTADEADALTQMTVVLTKHIGDMATLFTEKMNSLTIDNEEQVNNYTTNIFLEAGNSSTYIQNAFQLTLPILQIGAV